MYIDFFFNIYENRPFFKNSTQINDLNCAVHLNLIINSFDGSTHSLNQFTNLFVVDQTRQLRVISYVCFPTPNQGALPNFNVKTTLWNNWVYLLNRKINKYKIRIYIYDFEASQFKHRINYWSKAELKFNYS